VPNDLLQAFDRRPGYTQDYQGLEFKVKTTFAATWDLEVNASSGQHREYFDAVDAAYDPTPLLPTSGAFALASPNLDGGSLVRVESGSYIVVPTYQATATLSG